MIEEYPDEFDEEVHDVIDNFYTIEEYSVFNTADSSSQKKIIHKERKVK